MFRKLTLFAAILAFCIAAFVLNTHHDVWASLICNWYASCQDWNLPQSYPNSKYFFLPALLAVISIALLFLSWWQKHCRLAAMAASGFLLTLIAALISLVFVFKINEQVIVYRSIFTMLSMACVWLLFWMYLRVNPAISNLERFSWVGVFARIAVVLLLVEIGLGILVTDGQATLACGGFPECNGSWWPQDNYRSIGDLFSLYSTYPISLDLQVAVHWLHRMGALFCLVVFSVITLTAGAKNRPRQVRIASLWLIILLIAQISFGIAIIELGAPLWATTAHSSVAILLMLPLIAISFYSRYGYIGEQGAPAEVAQQAGVITVGIETPSEKTPESLFVRLKTQLNKTRSGLSGVLAVIPLGQKSINADLLEEIEASLLMADIGVDATAAIINRLTTSVEKHQLNDVDALTAILKQELLDMLQPCNLPLHIPKQDKPFVILVVGVNGAGKTTTIGKLAKRLQIQGHSVMLAAGDTFRAAAVEQLQTWGERNNIPVVAQHTGADSASVIYDALQSAQAKGVDVLIADTAGRLHTKSHLMDELKKVKRIMSKLDESAPHEVLLVLDAGTGQNALSQARLFNETVALTGLALTKLDGTAKGGVIFALAKQFGIPIRYIGIGEGIDDLQDFDADNFVNALFIKD
jgi:fused signal recognition particle receptor